ncbi:MAG TPA: hypothetical protein VMT93_07725, partial [Gemmatimonadaceae bacterium]|nr:hypothetical protein [Gemmatimonadaceae bacterium]
GESEAGFGARNAARRAAGPEPTGERLSRDEAFTLIRRALAALASAPDRPAPASRVRDTARELLGRDSETLAERHFHRILRDMHDAELIDLRKRGDDYEVTPSLDAPPIADQLAAVDAAHAEASQAARAAANAASLRRGIRTRGRRGGAGELPPELLSVGVVGDGAPPAVSDYTVELPAATDDMADAEDAASEELLEEMAEGDAPADGAEGADGAAAPVRRRRRGVRGGRGRRKS